MRRALVDLVLPDSCCACAAPGAVLCGPCVEAVHGAGLTRLTGVVAPADPHAIARAAARAHKEQGRTGLAAVLAPGLARAVEAVLGAARVPADVPVVLVPVPQRASAARRRGFDPAERLAREAAGLLRNSGLPVRVARAARLTRQPRDQRGLGLAARQANVAGAMVVPRSVVVRLPPGCAVVVVDDVVTTGATLGELDRALTAAGLPPVGAAAAVAVPGPQVERGARLNRHDGR